MSTSSVVVLESRRSAALGRAADLLELTKPKIAVMELVTVTVAACVASRGLPADGLLLLHALIGTALVAASASALNQWLEIDVDGRMPRTARRPLPDGRLPVSWALTFGAGSIVLGSAYLAWLVNPLTAGLGLLTWFLYVWVYTPMKTRTPLNTVVGAVAGALPALMGWSAMSGGWTGQQGLLAATLFLIVFLWQFPHFMAIAWLYRHDYAQGGMKMLTTVDPSGRRAGGQAIVAALLLIPVSLLPAAGVVAFAGPVYFVLALSLGVWQFIGAVQFAVRLDETSARRLLRMSLVYLPGVLLMLLAAPLLFPRF